MRRAVHLLPYGLSGAAIGLGFTELVRHDQHPFIGCALILLGGAVFSLARARRIGEGARSARRGAPQRSAARR